MKPFSITALTTCILFTQGLQSQPVFSNLDSLLQYATAKNISLQRGDIQFAQAKQAKLAALLSIPDVTGNVSFSYTNNTQLPVNLFPAETFGGQPGTYKEIQTGVQYGTALNENIDIKLLNLKGWENLKLAKLNIEATALDNRITLKQLQENVASAYFNIVNLQEQVQYTLQNLDAADTLLKVTENKYSAGLIKQQDVNDAKVNYLTTEESVNQIRYLITQQYLGLKILCDIPETDSLLIVQKIKMESETPRPVIELNSLAVNSSILKEKVAGSNYKQQRYALYPTVSFFQAYSNQQFNTRGRLFDSRANWIPSSYIGLRINIPIPSSNTISQTSKARYDYLIARKNTEQQRIKAGLQAQQLAVDHEKALSQARANEAIYKLRTETWQKNRNLYQQGLLGLDQTLTGFNAMVNAGYNFISSVINVQLALAKITINNTIQ
jgi:outer membrane protein TolC